MLLIASGNNNIILTSTDGVTYTLKNGPDVSGNTLTDQTWDGNHTYILVGGSQIWTSTDGGVTFTSQTLPAGTGFGLSTGLGASGVLKTSIWDGKQFVVVGWLPGSPTTGVVGTSPNGITWTWTALAGSTNPIAIAFNGAMYVVLDWGQFIPRNSRFYSASSPAGPWTLSFTSAAQTGYGWLGSNGSGFISFDTNHPVCAYSADGLSWAENTTTGMTPAAERFSVIWDIPSSQWIVNGILLDGNEGISTSPTGAVFTTQLELGAGDGASGWITRGTSGNLFAWMRLATGDGSAYTSADNGNTWTVIGGVVGSFFTNAVWTGSVFSAYRIPDAADDHLASSTDLLIWTDDAYDDADADILILRMFSPVTPNVVYNNAVLLRYMGTSKGFSLLTAMPGGRGIITLREVQPPAGGTGLWPLAGNGAASMMALTDDAKSYVLFAGSQDGTISASGITQPLPTPTDLPPDLWNSNKKFRSIWIEGEDLGNYQVFAATDRQLNPDGTVNVFDWGPFSIINNKVDLGMGTAKRIVLKFLHNQASAPGVTPLISFINLNYDIMAEAN